MRVALVALGMAIFVLAETAPAAPIAPGAPSSKLNFGYKRPASRTTEVSTASKTPQMFAKIGDGTRRAVDGARNWFVPKKSVQNKRSVTVSRRVEKPAPPKQSFFKRMFAPESPPTPRTVDEWMSLDQVHP